MNKVPKLWYDKIARELSSVNPYVVLKFHEDWIKQIEFWYDVLMDGWTTVYHNTSRLRRAYKNQRFQLTALLERKQKTNEHQYKVSKHIKLYLQNFVAWILLY
jgi:hypothetical protein